jgi:hypothetical protein
MVLALKGYLNFEMQTRRRQLQNNTRVNIVTKIQIHITQTVFQ